MPKKKKPKMSDGANNAPYGPARRMRLRRKHQLVVLSILWKMRNYYLRLCRQKDAEQRRLQEVGRRYWVHPINVRRETRGHIGCLYDDLRRHPDKFQDFVRLPMEAFDNLLSILTTHLQRQDTYMRKSIPPVGRLLITLRFLATGESYVSLHLQFRVGTSTISGIVRCTCAVIWEHLQPIVMPSPTREIWLQSAAGFQSVANFPNCIGAVDGKHIRVKQPPRSGSQYFNYKKFFSVVLIAVVDSTYRFLAIDVGSYGSTGDSRALLRSEFGRRILLDHVTLPPPTPLPGTTHPAPFVMVGDQAFPLLNNLLRPYPRRGLDERGRVFNRRLSRARNFVECAFGIMTSQWRVFTTALQLKLATVDMVIKAACVLHNYLRDYAPTPEVNVETLPAFSAPINYGQGRQLNRGIVVRNLFADYFMTPEGAVPVPLSQPPL
ncbi:uncharacterized protein [Dendropsophus ebraccatus]|uniref:uncharacterized protein n=1 Tax=Dendropsophus ebraccatus TaxID=150705 RepID=UPI0038319625